MKIQYILSNANVNLHPLSLMWNLSVSYQHAEGTWLHETSPFDSVFIATIAPKEQCDKAVNQEVFCVVPSQTLMKSE